MQEHGIMLYKLGYDFYKNQGNNFMPTDYKKKAPESEPKGASRPRTAQARKKTAAFIPKRLCCLNSL